jgi:HAD superfamily hydrolase (TIGR01662 family)
MVRMSMPAAPGDGVVGSPPATIHAVFLDVGETLIDETRIWGEWADWLGVPRLTFFAVLGSLAQRGEPHGGVFEVFRPGFDLATEVEARAGRGFPQRLVAEDLYPDAIDCLAALRADGYLVGIAGNQPRGVDEVLRGWDLPVDVIGTSAAWGVEKPSPDFFERVVSEAGVEAGAVAYVGDRVDNDVVPAARAGLRAVLIERGPWGHLQASWPEAGLAAARIGSLSELGPALRRL